MKLFILLGLFTNLLAFGSTLNSNTGRGFDKNEIDIYISSTDCSGAGFSTATFRDLVEDAVDDYWNAVPTADLKLNVKGVSNIDIAGKTHNDILNDGLVPANAILAGCNQSFASPTTLGGAVMSCTGNTCRAVLIINSGASSQMPNQDRDTQIAVIAHEVGHAIGLGHTEISHNLMYFNISGKTQNWLGQDDIDGVSYLYPHDEPALGCDFLPLLGSMGAIKDISDDDDDMSGGFMISILAGVLLSLLFFTPTKIFKSFI
ncbi:MAG: matrixin family metalloprotease [Bacteriovoracaceae bacterium]|nr:matrixin family metalloprotease [Bacteriovoracaceae bacterium]